MSEVFIAVVVSVKLTVLIFFITHSTFREFPLKQGSLINTLICDYLTGCLCSWKEGWKGKSNWENLLYLRGRLSEGFRRYWLCRGGGEWDKAEGPVQRLRALKMCWLLGKNWERSPGPSGFRGWAEARSRHSKASGASGSRLRYRIFAVCVSQVM